MFYSFTCVGINTAMCGPHTLLFPPFGSLFMSKMVAKKIMPCIFLKGMFLRNSLKKQMINKLFIPIYMETSYSAIFFSVVDMRSG